MSTNTESEIDFTVLQGCIRAAGLHLFGITDVSSHADARKRLVEWQDAGYAGDLKYMLKDPELFTDPTRLMPEGKTLIVFSVDYGSVRHPPATPGTGRVARYAWGRDYHKVIRKRLKQLIRELELSLGKPVASRHFCDAVPLLERGFAERSSLGFVGKNTMLIQPGRGSFFFLAELLTDIRVRDIPGAFQFSGSCGSCTRCLRNCPTDAFVSDYVLDSRKCISYLTIEKRGGFSREERRMLGNWLFGCDVCQDVCPFNHRGLKAELQPPWKEFSAEAGAGPLLLLEELIRMRTDDQFLKRFAGTPLIRAKREGLIRNALCVAVNTAHDAVLPAIREAVVGDASPVIRGHALWAMVELEGLSGEASRSRAMIEKALDDPAPEVREEAGELLR